MAPAGIVELIARTGSGPCLQHQRKRARCYIGSEERLNAIDQPRPTERHRQHGAAIVGGDAAANLYSELPVWSFELPPIDAIVTKPHADAAMPGEIIRAFWGAKSLKIGWRSSDDPAQ